MNLSTSISRTGPRSVLPRDVDVLRVVLEQQHRARIDQIEALLCIAASARTGDAHRRAVTVARAHADGIEAALQRMAAGTYGACARCARPIDRARLFVNAATIFCTRCAHEA